MLRCKYRVISHTVKDRTTVHLLPVMPKSKYDPEGSPDNRRWWEATPSGKLDMTVPDASLYPIGQAVLVDLALDDNGTWDTREFSLAAGGRVDLTLTGANGIDVFEAGITALPAAAMLTAALLPRFQAELEARQKADTDPGPWGSTWRWTLALTLADH